MTNHKLRLFSSNTKPLEFVFVLLRYQEDNRKRLSRIEDPNRLVGIRNETRDDPTLELSAFCFKLISGLRIFDLRKRVCTIISRSLKILMEHRGVKNNLDSKLQNKCICSIRICSRTRDILKNFHNQLSNSPVLWSDSFRSFRLPVCIVNAESVD